MSYTPFSLKQSSDSDLTALAANSSNGIWAITGSGSGAARTITGTTNQINVSNGNGVSGNPVLSTPQNIDTSASPQFSQLKLGSSSVRQTVTIGSTTPSSTSTPESIDLGGTYSSSAGANLKIKIFSGSSAADYKGFGVSVNSLDYSVNNSIWKHTFYVGGSILSLIDSNGLFASGTLSVAGSGGLFTASATLHVRFQGAGDSICFMDKHNSSGSNELRMRRSRGTAASPTTVSSGDILADFTAYGYDGSSYASSGGLQFQTAETWGSSAHGSQFYVSVVPIGSTVPAKFFSVYNTGAFGYVSGNGGSVTQTTSRTTGVTINKSNGSITTNSTSLSAGSTAKFTVSNSLVSATDIIMISIKSGTTTDQTDVKIQGVGAGTFDVVVANRHASTAETGAIVLNYAIIKSFSS